MAEASQTLRVYPEDWPTDCPPNDARVHNGALYRIGKTNPPTERLYKTYHELGMAPDGPPCERCGLSVFLSPEGAKHQLGLTPKLGKHIFRAEVGPGDGSVKQTFQPPHHTWWCAVWVDRSKIFVHVLAL